MEAASNSSASDTDEETGIGLDGATATGDVNGFGTLATDQDNHPMAKFFGGEDDKKEPPKSNLETQKEARPPSRHQPATVSPNSSTAKDTKTSTSKIALDQVNHPMDRFFDSLDSEDLPEIVQAHVSGNAHPVTGHHQPTTSPAAETPATAVESSANEISQDQINHPMARFFDNLDEENPPATGTLDATNTSKKLASAPASQLEDTFGDNDGLVGYNSRSPMAVAQDEATTLPMATSLRRNPRLVVPTAPGAVAVGPNEFANGADLIDRINIAADQHFDEHKSTSSSNADNGLVTAIPVEEDSAAFISQEAQPFDHSMEELRLLYRKRAQRRTLYCRIMAAITITVPIIVVGVYFGLKGGEQESQSPTFSPTPFPSSAPSIFELEDLLDDIPNHTLISLNDPQSPQSLAYEWLLDYPNITSVELWRKKQLFAMVTFYFAFAGPSWFEPIKNDWLIHSRPECQWFSNTFGSFSDDGTFVSYQYQRRSPCKGGKLVELDLGPLGDLLESNAHIPREIAFLTSLQKVILPEAVANASFSYMVPTELFQMQNLTEINFSGQRYLSGTIPTELGLLTSLSALQLAMNRLSGPIPSELGNLGRLTALNLGWNLLSGKIPSELGSIQPLWYLQIFNNRLTGNIPSEVGQLSNLLVLQLHSNFLSGAIPTEFGLMTSLLEGLLSDNRITGTILTELAMLTHLGTLYLDHNSISGTIPILSMPSYELNLGHNVNLTGRVPSELGNLGRLIYIGLENTQVTGAIPSELGRLGDLEKLDLANTLLTGPIPTELGELVEPREWNGVLSFLNISGSSGLTGIIPEPLCRLGETSGTKDVICTYSGRFAVASDWNLGYIDYNCSLAFDCTDWLCGCDCPC